MAKEPGLLDVVRQRYRKALEDSKHPVEELWDWAESGDTAKDRADRYEALSAWARKKERQADERDIRELWDSRSEIYRKKYRAALEVAREQKRRRKRREERRDDDASGDGISMFDGRQVPTWMVPELTYARAHGWNGTVVSGIRSPEYSEQLCYQICGASSCPGRCAGRASNHNATVPVTDGEGAIDVSDYATFGRIITPRGKLRNALGAQDPVHFSRSGQ